MTFNIEPAIYVANVGGMRHCGVVTCTRNRVRVLIFFEIAREGLAGRMKREFSITAGSIGFYTVPANAPEADGTIAWDSTSMVLDAEAVTVLQADCTRCGGISGFLSTAALCWAHNIPLSSHCGPSMHLHACCSVPRAVHMEYFHDHARIERIFSDGFREPVDGC